MAKGFVRSTMTFLFPGFPQRDVRVAHAGKLGIVRRVHMKSHSVLIEWHDGPFNNWMVWYGFTVDYKWAENLGCYGV